MEPAAFFKAMAEGEISALLVFGADPVTLLPADADVKSALHKLGFIFVAESSDTGISELAQVRVPEATHFEKEGTFTNEARRVQKFSQAIPGLGESRPAWQIAAELAKRLGAPWKFNSAADVFEAMAKVVPDYNGLTLSAIPDDGVGLGEDSTKSETETAKEG
jgi:predicted molibdopterin-dependent oxidoreductase YjgC